MERQRLARRLPGDHDAVSRRSFRRSRRAAATRLVDDRERLRRDRSPRFARRIGDADVRGESRDSPHVLQRGGRRASRSSPASPVSRPPSASRSRAKRSAPAAPRSWRFPRTSTHSDWRETRAHYSAIIGATPLSCMLYNNPIAYHTDVTAPQLAELAERARESARGQGVERRRPARDGRSRGARRSARGVRRARRHDPRGDSGWRDGLDRGTGQRAAA